MQDTELRPRGIDTSIVGGARQAGLSVDLVDFQQAYEASLQRAAIAHTVPGYPRPPMDAAISKSRGWVTEARVARLAADNDRLRAQESLLLDQLSVRNAELALRDAEIRDLKAQLVAVTEEDAEAAFHIDLRPGPSECVPR
jgi:hypothetical protein